MNIPDAPRIGGGFGQAEEFVQGGTKRAPWKASGTITPTKTTFFVVHLGVMRKRAVVEGVLRSLDPEGDLDQDALDRVSGDASMGALVLDWEGRILCSQFEPAPFVFGVRRLRAKKPLSDIAKEMAETISENLGKRFGQPIPLTDPFKRGKDPLGGSGALGGSTGSGGTRSSAASSALKAATPNEDGEQEKHAVYEKPATLADLHTISRSLLGVAALEADRIAVRIVAREVKRKDGKPLVVPDFDEGMLPSFFAQDIDRVIRKKRTAQSPALQAYLGTPVPEKDRTDLLSDDAAFAGVLHPECLSLGRWPSDPRHSLNIAQQAAVGQVRALDAGLLAINGPPGTGKTTLLRDMVADMVVERASRMAQLERADDGMDEVTIKPDGDDAEPFSGALVDDRLVSRTGVVVASSNNAAVENVSLALPTRGSIDTVAFPGASYIQQAAKDMAVKMAQGFGASSASTDVWGLAALRLGNKDNIRTVFQGLSRPFAREGGEQSPRGGVVDALQDMGPFMPYEWTQARRDFVAKRKEVEGLLALRRGHWQELRDIPVLEALLDGCSAPFMPLEEEVRAGLSWGHRRHRSVGVVSCAFRKGMSAAEGRGAPVAAARPLAGLPVVGMAYAQALRTRLVRARVLSGLFGLCWEVPTDRFFAQPTDMHHRASVWTDTRLEEARSELFLAALKLHEAFLRGNQRKLYSYMGMLRRVLTGDVRVKDAVLLRVWNSLFVLSPVVSTTLASMRRLPSGQAWIGLLLVDEAGQATPQSVVGALARAHKAVLVGDPLQIEPVFAVPAPIVKRLMREEAIPLHFSPLTESAQTVADGAMSMGAWVPKGPSVPVEGMGEREEDGQAAWNEAVGEGESGDRDDALAGSSLLPDPLGVSDPLGLWRGAHLGAEAPVFDAVDVGHLVSGRSFSDAEEDLKADGGLACPDVVVVGKGAASGAVGRVWTGMPLRVHRRCQEPMFGIANAISYGNQMVQGTPPPPEGALDGVVPSAWFDVWGGAHAGKVRVQEMEFLAASLRRLHQSPPRMNGAFLDMCVISPFVEVAEACRKVSGEVFGWNKARTLCPTGTVHTFQGQEKDVVFLVLGTAPGAAGHGSRLWASAQANLLNVALTRARQRVYVVGCADDWRGMLFFDQLYTSLSKNQRIFSYPSRSR